MGEQGTVVLSHLHTDLFLQLAGEHPGNEMDGLGLELRMIQTGRWKAEINCREKRDKYKKTQKNPVAKHEE